MNNLGIFRKILIGVLALLVVVAIGYLIIRIINDSSRKTEVLEEPAEENIEIRETSKIIEDGKSSIINLTNEGFIESLVEVPLGGVLQIKNDTDRDIMLDIRTENYIAGLMVAAGESSFSPVFTQEGEYTISEIVEEEINEEFSAKVIVK